MGKTIAAYVGDYYHPSAPIRSALERALESELADGAVGIRFAEDAETFVAMLADKPDAAILFAENRIDPIREPEQTWMKDAHAASVTGYVEEGGGWLAWHSGLASYPPEGEYVRMLRGYFLSHPTDHAVVRYDYAESTNGISGFELLDEHYFVRCEVPDTEVFLRSASVDGESIAGWRHAFGEGRVCCLTPAHREDGLCHGSVLLALREAVRWTARLS
ncbi:ThuA domain-containing protein [Paenibacillus sp. LHD-117]|uniref:ThuA domain-containing protein n=1 Tax=Paenibacillus sp. LHD-117 TaxID=3071412 RepID=UPI0027DEB60E|nr:ThuA domain-containing protein [Paenibacillus sp. LHD-117]MDQ6420396.1 ThuA domain-containing protein [Paenibacillus sp. LHD-117]